jgi:hypothetical protein
MVVAGFEHNPNSPGKVPAALPCGAESGAVGSEIAALIDPDLARIVARWPGLPSKVRGRILADAFGDEP